MNEKILRALVEAGAVKKVKITAEGSTIYVEAYTGSEVTTAKTIKGKLKTWSTIDSAAKWLRSLGIGQMQLDVAKWQPEQKRLMV
jgi:RecB family endonuclease NucS